MIKVHFTSATSLYRYYGRNDSTRPARRLVAHSCVSELCCLVAASHTWSVYYKLTPMYWWDVTSTVTWPSRVLDCAGAGCDARVLANTHETMRLLLKQPATALQLNKPAWQLLCFCKWGFMLYLQKETTKSNQSKWRYDIAANGHKRYKINTIAAFEFTKFVSLCKDITEPKTWVILWVVRGIFNWVRIK